MPSPSESLLPLWYQTAPPLAEGVSEAAPKSLANDAEPADTIVIGAGVTGLSAALHLAERGAKVTLLERDGPGLGSTGRANGQVIAGMQLTPDALIAAYGAEQGERLIEFSGNAPDLVFDLIARHAIACDAERAGWVQATRSERQMKSMQKLADAWARRGAPVALLDRGEIARLLGTKVYAGGWLDRRNGTIQPLAYARGLAAAAARTGVKFHCGVDVKELIRDGQQWRIRTNHGDLRAATVVLATNVFTSELRGVAKTLLGRSYLSAHSVQLATAPLSATQLASLLPERHSCGDTEHLRLRYFRLDGDNRFVIGGPGWLRPPRSSAALSFRWLEASARRMFPQLKDTPFEFRWSARDALTPDLLPQLCEPAPGLFSALGYCGRGLAIGTALGSVLARRVLGEAASTLPYPTTPASALPLNLPAAVRFYLKVASNRLRRWIR